MSMSIYILFYISKLLLLLLNYLNVIKDIKYGYSIII